MRARSASSVSAPLCTSTTSARSVDEHGGGHGQAAEVGEGVCPSGSAKVGVGDAGGLDGRRARRRGRPGWPCPRRSPARRATGARARRRASRRCTGRTTRRRSSRPPAGCRSARRAPGRRPPSSDPRRTSATEAGSSPCGRQLVAVAVPAAAGPPSRSPRARHRRRRGRRPRPALRPGPTRSRRGRRRGGGGGLPQLDGTAAVEACGNRRGGRRATWRGHSRATGRNRRLRP